MDHQSAAVNAISVSATAASNRIADRLAVARRPSEPQPNAAEPSAAISDTLETSDRESSRLVIERRDPPPEGKPANDLDTEGESGGLLDISG